MKFNKNIIIAVIAGVVAILAAFAAYLLYGQVMAFNEAKKNLKTSEMNLRRYYSMDPFPSKENVARVDKNVKVLNEWYGQLMTGLGKGQLVVPEMTPSRFLERFFGKKKELTGIAKKAGTSLPGNFNFGFDLYAGGEVPKPHHVKGLTEQLIIIEMLCKGLFAESAKSVGKIERDEFDALPGTGRPRPRPSTPAAGPGSQAVPVAGGAELYDKSHYVIEFTAKEDSVIRFINRLTRHGVFMVVTSLEFEASGTDVKEIKAKAIEAAAKKAAKGKEKLVRTQRLVSGKSFEKPMSIKLTLDVYRFKGEKAQ